MLLEQPNIEFHGTAAGEVRNLPLLQVFFLSYLRLNALCNREAPLQLFAIYKVRRKFYIRGMGANSGIGRSPYLA
jgi:hypothetical protein